MTRIMKTAVFLVALSACLLAVSGATEDTGSRFMDITKSLARDYQERYVSDYVFAHYQIITVSVITILFTILTAGLQLFQNRIARQAAKILPLIVAAAIGYQQLVSGDTNWRAYRDAADDISDILVQFEHNVKIVGNDMDKDSYQKMYFHVIKNVEEIKMRIRGREDLKRTSFRRTPKTYGTAYAGVTLINWWERTRAWAGDVSLFVVGSSKAKRVSEAVDYAKRDALGKMDAEMWVFLQAVRSCKNCGSLETETFLKYKTTLPDAAYIVKKSTSFINFPQQHLARDRGKADGCRRPEREQIADEMLPPMRVSRNVHVRFQ